ncbi:MAG: metallophosphoesterase [Bacteroidales bacterium]|nr:metallophosphoesterase [Bacteroidales bacterium]
MKNLPFVIFISTFLFIYVLAHWYVWMRLRMLWPYSERSFWLFSVFFVLLAFSFVFGRFTIQSHSAFHETAALIGAFWLIIALYLFLALLSFDIVRLINWIIPFLPPQNTIAFANVKKVAFYAIVGIVFLAVSIGYLNAKRPRLKEVIVETTKPLGVSNELTIAVVSDLHMGSLVRTAFLEKMVQTINHLHPDMVIIAGDLLDEAHGYIFKNDVGAPIRKLKSRLGVYAVPGNHEYIGGINSSEKYIRTLSLHWLKDSLQTINEYITIIGRDDLHARRMNGSIRKSLAELLRDIDSTKFNILIDHQPYHLDEVARYPVDLQISGHTHNGQFWPFNHVVSWVYTLPYGYKKIGNTHFYVSSGYGTWGPPVRIATIPEIVLIRVISTKI